MPGTSDPSLASRVEVLERNQKEILALMKIQRETTAEWQRDNKATQQALRLMAERIGQLGSQPRPPVTIRFLDKSGNPVAESTTGDKGIANFAIEDFERLLNGGR